MRTLHTDLTAAQQSASATPYMKIVCRSRDRATTRTYSTADSPNRIISVQQTESIVDEGGISSPGERPYSMVIRLRDHDNTLNALDYDGYRVDVGWGFNTGSGNRFQCAPMGFVRNTRNISANGHLYVELLCISAWDKLSETWANIEVSSVLTYAGNRTIRHILQEIIAGTSPDACILDDGGVPTDHTTAAGDTGTTFTVLPASPLVGDATYYGRASRFDRVSQDLTTVGAGTWTITWEYWNGSTWITLLDSEGNSLVFTSGAGAFMTGELQIISFILPNNAATSTEHSLGPYYYVRARVSSFTSITTQPVATRVYVGSDYGLALDTSNSAQDDEYQPHYQSDYRSSSKDIVEHMLEFTQLGAHIRTDGFHLKFIDNAQAVADYTYNTSHSTISSTKSSGVVIPNKIIYLDRDPSTTTTPSQGSATSSASVTAIGTIPAIIVDPSIPNDAGADSLAASHIKRLERDVEQGSFLAPMNVGQEIWDLASIVDARSGLTFNGRVSQIVRTYDPANARYDIQVNMGGVVAVSRVEFETSTAVQAEQRVVAGDTMHDINVANQKAALINEILAVMKATEEIAAETFAVIETAQFIQELTKTPELMTPLFNVSDPADVDFAEFTRPAEPQAKAAVPLLTIMEALTSARPGIVLTGTEEIDLTTGKVTTGRPLPRLPNTPLTLAKELIELVSSIPELAGTRYAQARRAAGLEMLSKILETPADDPSVIGE